MLNKIIQGDCLEVMPTLPDKSIDMILCDNRKYIGIEKEEKYVNIARERISNHTQQQDIFSMIEGV